MLSLSWLEEAGHRVIDNPSHSQPSAQVAQSPRCALPHQSVRRTIRRLFVWGSLGLTDQSVEPYVDGVLGVLRHRNAPSHSRAGDGEIAHAVVLDERQELGKGGRGRMHFQNAC